MTVDVKCLRRAAFVAITIAAVGVPTPAMAAGKSGETRGTTEESESNTDETDGDADGDAEATEPELKPGQVVTVAGQDKPGNSGDGQQARSAKLGGTAISEGMRIDIADDGTIYIADVLNDRIRVVDTDGVISTVAQTERPPPPDDDVGDDVHPAGRRVSRRDRVVIAADL